MSQTITIDGLEYSKELIKKFVPPVKRKPKRFEVWSFDGKPRAVYSEMGDTPYVGVIALDGSFVGSEPWRPLVYLAPSVEEYYKQRLEADLPQALERLTEALKDPEFAKAAKEYELLEAKARAFETISAWMLVDQPVRIRRIARVYELEGKDKPDQLAAMLDKELFGRRGER